MVLYENGLIRLDYDPATDVLNIRYPDLYDYLLPEIRNSIDILVDTIRNYDVKKVLLDSSKTHVGVDRERSREVTMYLVSGFLKTRLQKLARVQSLSEAVEQTAQANISHVHASLSLPFEFRNFTERQEALGWLAEDKLALAR
jgi:hypothetical protein